MAKQVVKKGDTSRIEYVFIQDSSSTTGAGLTGLAFNSAGLTAYYVRTGGTATAITLATQTANGAYSSGGFVAVDGTNMPGVYRLDIPDAVFATGVDKAVVMLKGATNMAPLVLEYQLVDYDPENATTLGLTNLDATVSSRLASASITLSGGAVTVGTNNDKTGYSLADVTSDAVIADAVWNGATASYGAAGSYGALIETNLDAAVSTRSTLDAAGIRTAVGLAAANLDTQLTAIDDYLDTEVAAIYNRIGAPAGASIAADVAAIKAETASIQTDTNDIQTRLPAALVGGRMDSNASAINNDATSAANLAKTTRAIGRGTVTTGGTTTSIPTSAFTPASASAVIDQFKGRIVTFDADTTTAELRGQATDITANTAGATPTFTVTALTTAPASGDTFSVT